MISKLENILADDEGFSDHFESESFDSFSQATSRKISVQLQMDGYRAGRQIGEENLNQMEFDRGFERGIHLGKLCGSLYANILYTISMKKIAIDEVTIKGVQSVLLFDIASGLLLQDAVNRLFSLLDPYHEFSTLLETFARACVELER